MPASEHSTVKVTIRRETVESVARGGPGGKLILACVSSGFSCYY